MNEIFNKGKEEINNYLFDGKNEKYNNNDKRKNKFQNSDVNINNRKSNSLGNENSNGNIKENKSIEKEKKALGNIKVNQEKIIKDKEKIKPATPFYYMAKSKNKILQNVYI